jgi:hypothetical protein
MVCVGVMARWRVRYLICTCGEHICIFIRSVVDLISRYQCELNVESYILTSLSHHSVVCAYILSHHSVVYAYILYATQPHTGIGASDAAVRIIRRPRILDSLHVYFVKSDRALIDLVVVVVVVRRPTPSC